MVGISLLTLVPGAIGGTETYARALTRALAEAGTLDYVAFVPPVAPEAGGGLRTVVVEEYRRARTIPQRFAAMALAGARPGPIRRRFGRLDVMHYALTIQLPSVQAPTVVTLQDVLHLDHPELFPKIEALLRKIAYDRSAKSAGLVIVPTEFVRDRVGDRLGISADRLRVVAHGIDHERFTPGDEPREPFLLYPARPWPHKNHARLFDAFALLRREQPELELVLTGGGHERTPRAPGVVVKGLVGGDELVSLYRRASALVFPSLYEGWGAPPLEAMASGCPVAASAEGSLGEVCGDAAVSFDPRSPEDIAAKVAALLDDPAPYVERGLKRASLYSWAESGRGHEAVYRELV